MGDSFGGQILKYLITPFVVIMLIVGFVAPGFNPAMTSYAESYFNNLDNVLDYLANQGYGALADSQNNLTTQNVVPAADSTYNVGASGNEYANLYADNGYFTSITGNLAGNVVGALTGTVDGANVTKGSTIKIAASNATASERALADYVVSGTAEDEINAAFAELVAAGNAGTIEFSSGTFTINLGGTSGDGLVYGIWLPKLYLGDSGYYANLRDTNPINVIGQHSSTIFKLGNNQDVDAIFLIGNSGGFANESVHVSGIYIDGNRENQTSGSRVRAGIYVAPDMNYGFIDRVEVISCNGSGIVNENNRYWQYSRVGCSGNGQDGLRVWGGYQNQVFGGYYFSNGDYGIALTSRNGTGSHRNQVIGSATIGNGIAGISVVGNNNIIEAVQSVDEGTGTQDYGVDINAASENTTVKNSVLWNNVVSPFGGVGINPNISGNNYANSEYRQEGVTTYYGDETLATSDHTFQCEATQETVGEATTYPDLVFYNSDGKWYKAIATAENTTEGRMAIAYTASGDATTAIFLRGFLRDDTWNWTTSATLYASNTTAGGIMEGAPTSSGEYARIIGYAVSDDVIWFDPDNYYTAIP